MARNTGNNGRVGPVKNRYQEQVQVPAEKWAKYDRDHNLVGIKDTPWKGVPKR